MTMRKIGLAGIVAAAATCALVVLVFAVRGSQESGSLSDNGVVANSPSGGRDVGLQMSSLSLPLGDLIRQSDAIVVGAVSKKDESERSDIGVPGLRAIDAVWQVDVERYIKGSGGDTLVVRRTVAYEVSPEEFEFFDGYDDSAEGSIRDVDDPAGLTVGRRYVLALRETQDGGWSGTAEPYRFRLEDGMAVMESTASGGHDDTYIAGQFPAKSEIDLIADIEALVAAQAAEAAVH